MRIDLGLEQAVGSFTEALTPLLRQAVAGLAGRDPSAVPHDVVVEAYNLALGFIDADGLATDDELWSLIRTFSPLLDIPLLRATPQDVREAGLTTGAAAFLAQPSTLLQILVGLDRRNGSHHAAAYYEHSLGIGYTVASLDLLSSRSELLVIERFRAMLLASMAPADEAPTESSDAAAPKQSARAGTPAPPDAAAETAAQGAPTRPLDELLAELGALVGLKGVKDEVRLVANLIRVQNLRRARGLPVLEQSRHLVFTGNPGTGKTTVARLLAQIYRSLGVVSSGHLVETDRAGLVAGYVGQTATKVTAVFDRADEGVLLIDEAYALVRGSSEDFGREAIDTIVKLVEDRRDRLVVIAAGYPDEMDDFVGANPGLRSRFPTTILFPDYTTDELIAIFETLCKQGNYRADTPTTARVRTWLEAQPRTKGFGNGRLVRNLFEAAVGRQAGRIVALTDPTDEQLIALSVEDIPAVEPGGRTP